MNEQELWMAIVGYEGAYEVSSLGRVRSLARRIENNGGVAHIGGTVLKASPDAKGYPTVALWSGGRSVTTRVHRLVAAAFVPGQREGLEVCHGDGNPGNNHFTNLRWDTRAANMSDMSDHGRNAFSNRTACPKGHPYDQVNTITSGGRRVCRTCHNALRRRRRAQVREALGS